MRRKSSRAGVDAISWLLAMVIAFAPAVTTRAMLDITTGAHAASSSAPAPLPCHPSAVHAGDDGDKAGASTQHHCVCTPWCAFSALPAYALDASPAGLPRVAPYHRAPVIKIASVDPPFKPPRS